MATYDRDSTLMKYSRVSGERASGTATETARTSNLQINRADDFRQNNIGSALVDESMHISDQNVGDDFGFGILPPVNPQNVSQVKYNSTHDKNIGFRRCFEVDFSYAILFLSLFHNFFPT